MRRRYRYIEQVDQTYVYREKERDKKVIHLETEKNIKTEIERKK